MVDPTVMEGLLSAGDRSSSHLQELSPRELEILGWVAKGYRNNTIADLLSRDVKTIERHLNNIYSKLQSGTEDEDDEAQHPRVRATLLFLRATGLLPPEQPYGV